MPARCESCGEEALTDTARFCIGCGAALPEVDPRAVLAELAQSAPPELSEPPPVLHLPSAEPPPPPPLPPPPTPTPTPRVDTPAFTPRPVPSRSEPAPPPPRPPAPPAASRPQRPPPPPPLRDLSPVVPLSLVVAGVIGLLALLLILLLAA